MSDTIDQKWLKNNLKSMDCIYGLVHKNRYGKVIQVFWIDEERKIVDLTSRIAFACQYPLRKKGLFVSGSGYNHFEMVKDSIEMIIGHKLRCEILPTE